MATRGGVQNPKSGALGCTIMDLNKHVQLVCGKRGAQSATAAAACALVLLARRCLASGRLATLGLGVHTSCGHCFAAGGCGGRRRQVGRGCRCLVHLLVGKRLGCCGLQAHLSCLPGLLGRLLSLKPGQRRCKPGRSVKHGSTAGHEQAAATPCEQAWLADADVPNTAWQQQRTALRSSAAFFLASLASCSQPLHTARQGSGSCGTRSEQTQPGKASTWRWRPRPAATLPAGCVPAADPRSSACAKAEQSPRKWHDAPTHQGTMISFLRCGIALDLPTLPLPPAAPPCERPSFGAASRWGGMASTGVGWLAIHRLGSQRWGAGGRRIPSGGTHLLHLLGSRHRGLALGGLLGRLLGVHLRLTGKSRSAQ